jgi:hypothetical protein
MRNSRRVLGRPAKFITLRPLSGSGAIREPSISAFRLLVSVCTSGETEATCTVFIQIADDQRRVDAEGRTYQAFVRRMN